MPNFLISKIGSDAIEDSYVLSAEDGEHARRLLAMNTDAAEATDPKKYDCVFTTERPAYGLILQRPHTTKAIKRR